MWLLGAVLRVKVMKLLGRKMWLDEPVRERDLEVYTA